MNALAPFRKAAVATIGAATAGIGGAMIDGSLTMPEIITATGAALVFGFAAWRIPNTPDR